MVAESTEAPAERGDVLLIQFAKAPVPGQVKTRMLPVLNPVQACELHTDLLLWTARQLCAVRLGPVELWLSGERDHPIASQCIELGVSAVRTQHGADLGQRMQHAIAHGLARYRQVILVGSDCPAIDCKYLQQASCELATNSVVLGPADDGGYVLVGAVEAYPAMFRGISWGENCVYDQTVTILEAQQVAWSALASLADIDRPDDLPIWQQLSRTGLRPV